MQLNLQPRPGQGANERGRCSFCSCTIVEPGGQWRRHYDQWTLEGSTGGGSLVWFTAAASCWRRREVVAPEGSTCFAELVRKE